MALAWAFPRSALGVVPDAALSSAELGRAGFPGPARAVEAGTGHPAGLGGPEEDVRRSFMASLARLERGRFAAGRAAMSGWLRRAPLSPDRPAASLALGIGALGSGDARGAYATLHGARATYRDAIVADDLALWEGEAAWALDDPEGAAAAFRIVATAKPSSALRGQAAYRLAWALNRLGDLSAAATHFAEAAHADLGLADSAELQRGWVLLQSNRVPEARDVFAAVEARLPAERHAREAIVGRAECAYRTEQFEDARVLYDQALARAPDAATRGPLRYSLAWTALRQGQTARARQAFVEVERDFPIDPVAPFAAYRGALCLYDLDRPDEALVELKGVQARYPTHEVGEWAAYSRGWIHLALGRFHEAKAAYRGLLDEYPKGKLTAPARYLFATALYQERRFREAEREFLPFVDAQRTSGLADAALLWAGWAALLDGRPAEALAHLDRLPVEFPASPLAADAAVAEGEAAFAARQVTRAKAAYGRAAQSTGAAKLRGLTGLGWCAFAVADWKDAEKQFRAALAAATTPREKVRARVRAADALFNQKKFDEAKEQYRQVIAGPEEELSRWAQLQSGWCAARADDPDEARRIWDQLRRRWPGSPEAPLALEASAETLFRQERYADAETLFRKLGAEAPGGSDLAERAVLRVGDSLYNAKAYPQAVIAYRTFTERYGSSTRLVEALYGMQWAYLQMGDYERAREQAREFLGRFPQASLAAEVQLMVAESWRREKKPSEALGQYRKLIEAYPDSDLAAAARMKSGETLEELSRPAEAEAAYTDFLKRHPKHALAREALFRTGVVRYAGGNLAGAEEVFDRVARDATDPRAPEALYNLLLCKKKKGDAEGMKSAVKRLAETYGRTKAAAQARLALAYHLTDTGDASGAIPHFTAATEAPFKDIAAEAAYALGDAAAQKNDDPAALGLFLKGSDGLPAAGEWGVQCAFAAADAQARMDKHDDAIGTFRRVLEMETATAEWQATALFGIGQRYEATERRTQAIQMYRQAIQREPGAELKAAIEDRLRALEGGGDAGAINDAPDGADPAPVKATPKPKKSPERTGKPAGAPKTPAKPKPKGKQK